MYSELHGKANIVECLQYIHIPEEFENTFFYPSELVYTIYEAQFGVQDKIACYCSECSLKQTQFKLIESVCDPNFKLQSIIRLNILLGLIVLSGYVSSELQHQVQAAKHTTT